DGGANDPVLGQFAGLPEGAPLTINGQAFHITYKAGDGNDVAVVRNTAAMITDVSLTPEIAEGGLAILGGRLGDPNVLDQFFVDVDWGDGSLVEHVTPGREPLRLSHRYRDDNPSGTPFDDYRVRFTWGDGSGETRSDSRLVRVDNVAPVVDAGGDTVLDPG